MTLKTITKDSISNKKVLLRVDFNVPLKEVDGKFLVQDDTRIKNALKTITFLLENQAQVIIISHLGRPEGKMNLDYSLLPTARKLSQLLNQDVLFTTLHEALEDKLSHPLVMLENLRFDKEEEENSPVFAKKLASLAEVYVNESFSTSHRAHASVAAITEILPSYAGFALTQEVNYLASLIENPQKPFVVVVGGAKISDKISAIKKLANIADCVLVGGGVSNNFLKADGFEVANSYLEDKPVDKTKKNTDFVKFADRLLDSNQQEHFLINDFLPLPKIIYPVDVIAAVSMEAKTTQTINLLESDPLVPISDDLMYLDIGPKTIKLFEMVIKQAKTIFWNGPMGVFEKELFSNGTTKIAKAIAESQATSVLGGGDTISAIDQLKLTSKYTYISTAGGASLEFLSGKILPGLKPLT